MESIIMPEIITPAFVDVLASKPEILEQLLGTQSGEAVVANRDIEFNCYDTPQTNRFMFCNIIIKLVCSKEVDWEPLGFEEVNEGHCRNGSTPGNIEVTLDKEGIRKVIEILRIIDQQLSEKNRQVEKMLSEVAYMKEKAVILDTRMKESKKTLKLIISEVFNRKLSYKYKADIMNLTASLDTQNKQLTDKISQLEKEKQERDMLAEKRSYLIRLFLKYMEENLI